MAQIKLQPQSTINLNNQLKRQLRIGNQPWSELWDYFMIHFNSNQMIRIHFWAHIHNHLGNQLNETSD